MTITARYPGTCYACGRSIRPGEQIEWDKATRRTKHVACPAPELAKAPFKLSFTGPDRSAGPRAGEVYYDDEAKRVLTVVAVDAGFVSRQWAEDNDDFELEDGGWRFTAHCRLATDAEAAPIRAEMATLQARRAAQARVETIARDVEARGERPGTDATTGEVVAMQIPDGNRLLDTQNIHGGGHWFVVGPEGVWYVQNNGMDGDTWAVNNVRTGGAGAIGWRIPFDENLAGELRQLDTLLGEKNA